MVRGSDRRPMVAQRSWRVLLVSGFSGLGGHFSQGAPLGAIAEQCRVYHSKRGNDAPGGEPAGWAEFARNSARRIGPGKMTFAIRVGRMVDRASGDGPGLAANHENRPNSSVGEWKQ